MFFVVVGRPELGIKAVLDQKNNYALFLESGMCKAGIARTFHLAMCFFLFCRPMMLGIKAGMDQTDILALDTGSCMVKACFTTGYDTSRVFPWGCRQVCDVRHHGRYGPEEHVSSYLPQVQVMDEVVVPVVCNDIWPGPAGWVPFSAAPRIWQSLVRCSLWFDSGYMTSVYSGLWKVQFLDKVCLHFVVLRQVPDCPDISAVAQRLPMVQLFLLSVQFSDKVAVMPVVGQ